MVSQNAFGVGAPKAFFFRYKSGLKFTTRILPMRSLILLGSNTFRS